SGSPCPHRTTGGKPCPSRSACTMPIRVACPRCRAPQQIAEQLAGKPVRCSSCGGVFGTPPPAAPAPQPPAARARPPASASSVHRPPARGAPPQGPATPAPPPPHAPAPSAVQKHPAKPLASPAAGPLDPVWVPDFKRRAFRSPVVLGAVVGGVLLVG